MARLHLTFTRQQWCDQEKLKHPTDARIACTRVYVYENELKRLPEHNPCHMSPAELAPLVCCGDLMFAAKHAYSEDRREMIVRANHPINSFNSFETSKLTQQSVGKCIEP